MSAKCVNEEQSNWSQLPYVMMAYRFSVHESTGYTPQLLVFGLELSLPLVCKYPNPQENETNDIHEFVHNKQQAFQRAVEIVRRNLNGKQKRRNAIYSKKSSRPNIQRRTNTFTLPSSHRCWDNNSQAAGKDSISLKMFE